MVSSAALEAEKCTCKYTCVYICICIFYIHTDYKDVHLQLGATVLLSCSSDVRALDAVCTAWVPWYWRRPDAGLLCASVLCSGCEHLSTSVKNTSISRFCLCVGAAFSSHYGEALIHHVR